MSGPTILLVEDDPDDVAFFKRALAKAGLSCDLRVAEDGQQAMDQLSAGSDSGKASASRKPSHVLLDLKLPRKSGLEVLEWIRSHATLGRMPVIVLTSSELPSDVEQAQALGVDAYLVKPLSSMALLDTVRKIADRWKIPSVGDKSIS